MTELDRSLMALRLEVPKVVADDVERIVRAALKDLETENKRLEKALERIALGITGRRESGLREGEGGGYGLPNQPRADWELARAALLRRDG